MNGSARKALLHPDRNGHVYVMDRASGEVLSATPFVHITSNKGDVAFSPDGARAYVTAEIGGSVAVIDAMRHKVIATIDLPAPARPVGIVVSPNGRMLYVANGHGNSIGFVDTTAMKIVAQVPTGRRPWGSALTADGRKLYSANGVSGDVSVIDTSAVREIKRIRTGPGTWGVAIARPGPSQTR